MAEKTRFVIDDDFAKLGEFLGFNPTNEDQCKERGVHKGKTVSFGRTALWKQVLCDKVVNGLGVVKFKTFDHVVAQGPHNVKNRKFIIITERDPSLFQAFTMCTVEDPEFMRKLYCQQKKIQYTPVLKQSPVPTAMDSAQHQEPVKKKTKLLQRHDSRGQPEPPKTQDPANMQPRDFWRDALLDEAAAAIKLYNQWEDDKKTRRLPTTDRLYNLIDEAFISKRMPPSLFMDVSGSHWSLKEDGYNVKLIRNDDGTWSMYLRSGQQAQPPVGFLKGLETNKDLPRVMIGELLTCFSGCGILDRKNTSTRTAERNAQFAIIHGVLEGDNPDKWEGLRLKLFSFPDFTKNIQATYEQAMESMLKSLDMHPHIGMCRCGLLDSTEHAIIIFNFVVQMGLEGIVIVDTSRRYGCTIARKMKTKMVFSGREVINTGGFTQSWKDGKQKKEFKYTTGIDGNTVSFTDQIPKTTGYAKVKCMELAEDKSGRPLRKWPVEQGFRHLHFAMPLDMSVMPSAATELPEDVRIRQILGVDETVGRILNWGNRDDRKMLEKAPAMVRLFNPAPFCAVPKQVLLAISDDDDMDAGADTSSRPPIRRHDARVLV